MNEEPSDEKWGGSLGNRSAKAFGWGAVSSLLKLLCTVVFQAILARLLGPTEFGLFALGMVVMGLAGYFADMGVATALVQRKEVRDDDIRFVLTWNLLTASVVAVLVMMLAPWLADLFKKPSLVWVCIAMAPVFVVNAAAAVSVSLLRRELDNRSIQFAGLLGYVFGFGLVGVTIAALGGSTLSLVSAFVAQAVVTLGLLYQRTRHVLGWRVSHPELRNYLGFGSTVLATNLVNWASSSVDRLVIGRLLNASELGFYSAAYNLIYAPVGALYPNLQSTVFAALARMQGDQTRMAEAYLALLRVVTLLFFPAFAGVYFVATPLALTILGDKWARAGDIAGAFCLLAPCLMVWACTTPVLWNSGRKSWEWKIQLPMVAVAAVAVAFAADYSIVAVAWAASTVYALRMCLVVGLAFRVLGMRLADLTHCLWPAVWTSAFVALPSYGIARLADGSAVSPWFSMVVGLIVSGILFIASLLLVPGNLPGMVRAPLSKLGSRMPRVLRHVFSRLGGDIT